MEAYFGLLIVILLLLLLSLRDKSNFMVKIIFIVLAFFSGLRFKVGIDFENYLNFYSYVNSTKELTKEPGFGYIVFYLKKWLKEPQFFFILFAFLTQYFYYKIITKQSQNIKLSILLYLCVISFYLFSFNVIRQTLAVAVFLYCLPFITNLKIKTFFTYIITTTFFIHLSIIFFIPLYFVLRKNINFIYKLLMFGGALIAGFFIKFIIIYTGYDSYLDKGDAYGTKITMAIYAFLILAFIIELTRSKFKESLEERVLFNMNTIGICVLLVLIMQTNSAIILSIKRIHNYILASYILIIPILINKTRINNEGKRFIRFILTFILILMYCTYIINNGKDMKLIPYEINLPF